jgi:hypothetical protein
VCLADAYSNFNTNGYGHCDANTYVESNRYAYRDFDTCAKSYSYTKGAPESATATVDLVR